MNIAVCATRTSGRRVTKRREDHDCSHRAFAIARNICCFTEIKDGLR